MKSSLLALFLLTACSHSVPKHEMSNLTSMSHQDCSIKKEDLRQPFFVEFGRGLSSTLSNAGSVALTTAGYATDVVLVGGTLVLIGWACSESNNSSCGDRIFHSFDVIGEVANSGFKGFGATSSEATAKWRCPYVDHISKALRKAANCNMKKEHYSAAYAHLNLIENNETLNECVTEGEKLEVQTQLYRIKASAVPN